MTSHNDSKKRKLEEVAKKPEVEEVKEKLRNLKAKESKEHHHTHNLPSKEKPSRHR